MGFTGGGFFAPAVSNLVDGEGASDTRPSWIYIMAKDPISVLEGGDVAIESKKNRCGHACKK